MTHRSQPFTPPSEIFPPGSSLKPCPAKINETPPVKPRPTVIMQPPAPAWPRGAVAGLLLALSLAIPLFVAIFADVAASADPNPKVAEAEIPAVAE